MLPPTYCVPTGTSEGRKAGLIPDLSSVTAVFVGKLTSSVPRWDPVVIVLG